MLYLIAVLQTITTTIIYLVLSNATPILLSPNTSKEGEFGDFICRLYSLE